MYKVLKLDSAGNWQEVNRLDTLQAALTQVDILVDQNNIPRVALQISKEEPIVEIPVPEGFTRVIPNMEREPIPPPQEETQSTGDISDVPQEEIN